MTTRDERRESWEWGRAAGLNEYASKWFDQFGTSSVEKIAARLVLTEGILRAVAANEPMVPRSDDYDGDWMCGFCEVVDHTWSDVEHRDDCPWRRAREWVDTHPKPHEEKT